MKKKQNQRGRPRRLDTQGKPVDRRTIERESKRRRRALLKTLGGNCITLDLSPTLLQWLSKDEVSPSSKALEILAKACKQDGGNPGPTRDIVKSLYPIGEEKITKTKHTTNKGLRYSKGEE